MNGRSFLLHWELYIENRLYYIYKAFRLKVSRLNRSHHDPGPFYLQTIEKDNMGARVILAAATGLGSGLSPYAPGTAGTIAGIPLYLLFSLLSWPLYFLTVVAFFFFAIYISQEAEKLYGQRDPSRIVIDEMTGFLVVMAFIPPSLFSVAAGFALFRFFDIRKPFPIRILERRLPGGYGVVGDDIMAGLYGNVILQVLVRVI